MSGAGVRYSLREPFERGLKSIRGALQRRGLRVVGQMDVSRRLERTLGILLPPCKIVFVLPLAPAPVDPAAATFLPLHVVVSSRGAQTEIQVLHRLDRAPGESMADVVVPVTETQTQICQAIETIAMRRTLVL